MPDREITELLAILARARRALTNEPGWDDSEDCVAVVESIDEAFGGPDKVPLAARGAYDDA